MNALAELRFAWRALRHSPGFVVTGIVALSFAITVAAVVFSVVDGVLLRPLPYRQSDRLVSVLEWSDQGQGRAASYPTFRDWAQQSRDLSGTAFARGRTETLVESARSARVTVGYVSPGFFRTMGEPALLGRALSSDDETTGGSGVVVLSHEFWAHHFDGDRSVIGRTIDLGGGPVVVVGVMPVGFSYPAWAEAWRPLEAIITDPAAHRRLAVTRSRSNRPSPGDTGKTEPLHELALHEDKEHYDGDHRMGRARPKV